MSEEIKQDLNPESANPEKSADPAIKEAPAEATEVKKEAEPISMMDGVKEGEPDAEKKPEDKKEDQAQAEIKAEDLKLPENSSLDNAAIDQVLSFAKEHKLNKEQAQAILEFENKALADFEKSQQDMLKQKSTVDWVNELKADKEFGGEKFAESIKLASNALKKFATPEFVSILESTGLGNNPELNRVFYRIGKAMADDTLVQPGAAAPKQKSIIERLYGEDQS